MPGATAEATEQLAPSLSSGEDGAAGDARSDAETRSGEGRRTESSPISPGGEAAALTAGGVMTDAGGETLAAKGRAAAGAARGSDASSAPSTGSSGRG